MGYTTEFTGRFDCYRVESPMMGEFLAAIRSGDTVALRAFADWLIDQGDPRGEAVSQWLAGGAEDDRVFWRLFGLKPEHVAYLKQFSRTRRMKRDADRAAALLDPIREAAGLPIGKEAAYFVGGQGLAGQARDESILDYNKPPRGQPGLWCQWVPSADGTAIEWDGGEKFYEYTEWLQYLIKHFLAPWGYILNGEVQWQGEDDQDRGVIRVVNNRVSEHPCHQ